MSAFHSVHWADFPEPSQLPFDEALVKDMDRVREICTAALAVRNAENIRVRQPLAELTIVSSHDKRLEPYFDIIQDEVNVKRVTLAPDVEVHADYKLQLNFPLLGKRLGGKMKTVAAAAKQGKWERFSDGTIAVEGEKLEKEECTLLLEPKEKKGTQVLASQDALVMLNLAITEELKQEGIARDLVRMIQQARKDADLKITDRIALAITAPAEIRQAAEAFKGYIADQTLSHSITFEPLDAYTHRTEHPLEDQTVVLQFSVAG